MVERRSRRRSVLAISAIAALLAACAPAAKADDFYGANVDGVWALPPAQQALLLGTLSDAGFKVARFNVNWETVEPQPGVFDWTLVDAEMAALTRAGLEPFPILDGSTAWDRLNAAGQPSNAQPWSMAPQDPGPFAQFAEAFALRYGVSGTFPTARVDPVHEYEIWNEENERVYYYPTDPVGYAKLYVAARAAVRTADPAATVIMGGLAAVWYSESPMFHVDGFTKTVLTTTASCPDAVGYHAYWLSTQSLLSSLSDFRRSLDATGCGRTPIELNEYNYVGSGSASANIAAAASALPGARLGINRMTILPVVSAAGETSIDSLPTLIDATGQLTPVGNAYSAIAIANPSPTTSWPGSGTGQTGPSIPTTTPASTATPPSRAPGGGPAPSPTSGGHPTAPPSVGGSSPTGGGIPAATNTHARAHRCATSGPGLTGGLGRIRLGMTKAQARRVYARGALRQGRYQDTVCAGSLGIHVGYLTPTLARALPRSVRVRAAGRVLWLTTTSSECVVDGIRAGESISVVHGLHRVRFIQLGPDRWYIDNRPGATIVLAVRGTRIAQIGVIDPSLTRFSRTQRAALRALPR